MEREIPALWEQALTESEGYTPQKGDLVVFPLAILEENRTRLYEIISVEGDIGFQQYPHGNFGGPLYYPLEVLRGLGMTQAGTAGVES